MQSLPADGSVVPMGKVPMSNSLSGHPRRRVPAGGAKLNAKEEGRKKPSLKSLFGVTPLDLLGQVSTEELPNPSKLFHRLLGTAESQATQCSSAAAEQPVAANNQLQWQEQQQQQQQQMQQHALEHPQIDTRTNLEKYMDMKLREYGCQMQQRQLSCYPPAPPQFQQPSCASFSGYAHNNNMAMMTSVHPSHLQSHAAGGFSPSLQQQQQQQQHEQEQQAAWDPQRGCWGAYHQPGQQYDCVQSVASTAPLDYRSSGGLGVGASSPCSGSAAGFSGASSPLPCSSLPDGQQLEGPPPPHPSWQGRNSYLPQVPQCSHMTAPVQGAPFHPGFSYATDFKFYYNYYPAEQYAGELDGEHAAAQEEAVAREQERAEELASRQVTEADPTNNACSLRPILTSKRRLDKQPRLLAAQLQQQQQQSISRQLVDALEQTHNKAG
ncbi:hypothetical protein Efla_002920 [Eimeria flavescens]